MADRARRELERAAAQGDVTARVRLLRDRLRAGELDERALMFAACLGDLAAAQATDRRPLPHRTEDTPVRRLIAWSGYEDAIADPWVRRALARIALAIAAAALDEALAAVHPRLLNALEVGRRALESPSSTRSLEAEQAATWTESEADLQPSARLEAALRCAAHALHAASWVDGPVTEAQRTWAAGANGYVIALALHSATEAALACALEVTDEGAFAERLRDDVAPELLWR